MESGDCINKLYSQNNVFLGPAPFFINAIETNSNGYNV